MARTKQLDDRHIEYLRAQIGSFISAHRNPSLETGATFLDESFEIWTLNPVVLSDDSNASLDLSRYLSKTGHWYHQLSQNGVPIGHSLSGPSAKFGPQRSLEGVFVSPLAKKVAKAIVRIDRDRPGDDTEAYYVVIPSRKTVFFFLRSQALDEVYVVQSTGTEAGPKEGDFYSPKDFIQSLSVAPYVRGLRLSRIDAPRKSGGRSTGRSSRDRGRNSRETLPSI
jgi:hypothetical protein